MGNNFFTCAILRTGGINNWQINTAYPTAWEHWVGWYAMPGGPPNVANRFLFIRNEYDDTKPSGNISNYDNWVRAELRFNAHDWVPGDPKNGYQPIFRVLKEKNFTKDTDPYQITWANHQIENESDETKNRIVTVDENWYVIDIPPELFAHLDSQKFIILREAGLMEDRKGCAKIGTHNHPDSDWRPWLKIYYMHWPGEINKKEEDLNNGKLTIEWDTTNIEGDTLHQGYRIISEYYTGTPGNLVQRNLYDGAGNFWKKYVLGEVISDFETYAGWSGPAEVQNISYHGEKSFFLGVGWTITSTLLEIDFAKYSDNDRISVWIKREFSVNEPTIRIKLLNANKTAYFYADYKCNNDGWQKVSKKKEEFTKYGNINWADVRYVEITNRNVSNAGNANIDYLIIEELGTSNNQNKTATETIRYIEIYPPNNFAQKIKVFSWYKNNNKDFYSPIASEYVYYAKFKPRNPKTSASGTTITVKWSPPVRNSYGQFPTQYQIYYRHESENESKLLATVNHDSSVFEQKYNHIDAQGRFYYKIRAYHPFVGYSEFTDEVEGFVNRKPTTSIAMPIEGSITDPNNTTITITFSDPDIGDIFQEGEIYITDGNSSRTIKTNSLTKIITDLESGKTYRIRARVSDQNGGWSDWTQERFFMTNSRPNISIVYPQDKEYIGDTEFQFKIIFEDYDYTMKLNNQGKWIVDVEDYCSKALIKIYDKNKNIINQYNLTPTNIQKLADGKSEVRFQLPSGALQKRKAYYYQIRAYDNHEGFSNQASNWSDMTQFFIYEATNSVNYTYNPPSISSIDPVNAEQGQLVTISGTNFGDIKNNTQLKYLGLKTHNSVGRYELNTSLWSDTQITFYAPKSREDAYMDKENNYEGFPLLTSKNYEQNKIFIIPRPGDKEKYVYKNGERVIADASFRIYAKTPIIDSMSSTRVGTNELVKLTGDKFGLNEKYNFIAGKYYTEMGDKIETKDVMTSVVKKVYDEENKEYKLESYGYSKCLIHENPNFWKNNELWFYVHEDAGSNIYLKSPWSANNSNSLTFSVEDIELDKYIVNEDGTLSKPILIWGEINCLTGKYLGHRQGNTKIYLTCKGITVELNKEVTFSGNAVYFLFGGFNLNVFGGQFPFGEPAFIRITKYFTDGQERCSATVEVECWKSWEDRRAYIEYISTAQRNIGYGGEISTQGLTTPPGGGGFAQKSLRIVEGDISFYQSGKLEFVTRRPKLLQDLLIAIMTPLGNDKYHPEYGCAHQFNIGDTMIPEQTENIIKTEIMRIINDYINRQKAQFHYKYRIHSKPGQHFIWDVESIKAIKDIKVDIDNDIIFIKIYLVTEREDIELQAKFKIGGY